MSVSRFVPVGKEVQPESPGPVTPILYVEVPATNSAPPLCTPHSPEGNADTLGSVRSATCLPMYLHTCPRLRAQPPLQRGALTTLSPRGGMRGAHPHCSSRDGSALGAPLPPGPTGVRSPRWPERVRPPRCPVLGARRQPAQNQVQTSYRATASCPCSLTSSAVPLPPRCSHPGPQPFLAPARSLTSSGPGHVQSSRFAGCPCSLYRAGAPSCRGPAQPAH